jgi:steroid delta-isomerase-like uncharacterized protein
MSVLDSKQVVRQFFDEIYNMGNLENVAKIVTSDFVYHARGEDITGIENFRNWITSDRSIFPDIRFTIVDSIGEFGKVAAAWIVEGTHEKEYRGIPATHKKFETVGISIFHFQNDKIKEAWTVADALTPALELGVVRTEQYQKR